MKITEETQQHQEGKEGDVIRIDEFDKLPAPVTARLLDGGEYWIESICVETGLMRLDICGLIQIEDFVMVETLIDANDVEHDAEEFLND